MCLARLTHSRAAPPHRRSRHPGPLPSDSADTATAETAPAPSPQRRRERSNFRLCSEWMTSAHIGNSTVPGSRCDLPVAHLLASVKCKSLRASVSAQYSQEHEGSCAEGRVRVGRQQGALFPPLSGVYGLKKKNLLIREVLQGMSAHRSRPEPCLCLILGAGVGHDTGRFQFECRGRCTNAVAPSNLAMAGQGSRDVGGRCPETSVARRAQSSYPRPGPAGRWFPPCPFPGV